MEQPVNDPALSAEATRLLSRRFTGTALLMLLLGLGGYQLVVNAIGVLLAFVVVLFIRVGPLSSLAWAQRITPWTPEGNLAAIVERGHSYYVPVEKMTSDGIQIQFSEHNLSLTHGVIYWGILLLVVVVGSLWIFRRRDVV